VNANADIRKFRCKRYMEICVDKNYFIMILKKIEIRNRGHP
jgi:hypothetical protein